ncbi:oligosaccharide flippase family protein [Desulfobacterales bacterium HSG17]|nr:oligosaccharide flippase family protein [Desulfobacterales bacterium HSG17]
MKFLTHKINLGSLKGLTAETFWVGFGVFFSTIGTFVGVRLLTTIMTPEEYGRLALGISIAMGLVYSIGVALWGTITRFFSIAKKDGCAKWYWKSIRRSLFVSSIFFSIIGLVLVLGLKLFSFSNSDVLFWLLALLFGSVQVIGETGSALQNGARNRKIFSMHQNLLGWGRFLIAYLIIQYWLPGARGALVGFVMAAVISMLSQRYWVVKEIFKHWPDKKRTADRSKEFFDYFKPLAYSGIFIWVQLFADRWALKSFASMNDVGIYFALYQISFAPALYCSNFLLHLLGPIFYDKAGDGSDQNRINKTTVLNGKVASLILVLILIGVGVAFWIGRPICEILIDSNYQKGFWAFPWLLATSGIYSVGQQFLMSVYSGVKTGIIIPFRIVTTIMSVGCYMIGGMFYGFTGIIGGGFVFAVLYLGLSFLMHRRMSTQQIFLEGMI